MVTDGGCTGWVSKDSDVCRQVLVVVVVVVGEDVTHWKSEETIQPASQQEGQGEWCGYRVSHKAKTVLWHMVVDDILLYFRKKFCVCLWMFSCRWLLSFQDCLVNGFGWHSMANVHMLWRFHEIFFMVLFGHGVRVTGVISSRWEEGQLTPKLCHRPDRLITCSGCLFSSMAIRESVALHFIRDRFPH